MQCKIGNRLRGGSGPVVWEGWHREASPIPIFDPSPPAAPRGDHVRGIDQRGDGTL
jgi:hypothetical protein